MTEKFNVMTRTNHQFLLSGIIIRTCYYNSQL